METWDYSPPNECTDCQVKEAKLDECRHFFAAILSTLYSDEPLDENLEHCLEEMAHYMGLQFPRGTIQVVRKNRTLEQIQFTLNALR